MLKPKENLRSASIKDARKFVITINKNGTYLIRGKRYSPQNLLKVAVERKKKNPGKTAFVEADRRVDWEKITRAGGKLYNLPIRIDDTGALTYTEIRRRARQHVKRYDTRLVIVDHLHITHGEKNQNRDREIGSITAGLKSAAKELNIPILLLAQLNRQLEMRQDKRPKLSDLRDSGNIEQDADMVMFLYRPAFYGDTEDYSGHTELCLAKQRDGPTGLVKLIWNEKTTTFQSLETRNLL